MAYSVKGLAIINDNRELLGVNTAGINTALYVGDVRIQDGVIEAQSGVVTFVGDGRSLTGIVTVSDSGGTPEFEGNLNVNGTLDVSGHIEGDSLNISGITTLNSLQFADAVSVNGISEDLTVSAASTQLVTAEAARAYADGIVGAGNTMEFTGNTGEIGAVDLVTETFAINGDANEIVTDVAVADGNAITIGLSNELIAPGSLQVTGLSTFASNVEYGTGVSFKFADDGTEISAIGVGTDLGDLSPSDAVLPTQAAVKGYVDGIKSDVEANASLRIEDAAGGIGTVALGTENLVFNGVANETLVEVSGAPGQLTVGLATDVTIAGSITVTNNFQFDGGQAIDTIGVSPILEQGGSGASDTVLPTELAVKTYVDAQLGTANQLNFEGDTGGQLEIDLATEVLQLFGTAQEIETVGAGNSMTFGLPDDVQVVQTLGATTTKSDAFIVGSADIDLIGETSVFEIQTQGATSLFQQRSSQTNYTFRDDQFNDLLVLDHSTTTSFASITGRLDVSAGAVITGVCTATDFNSTSDINKKENIVEISDALEKVEAIRGVTFDWKDGTGKSGGIIAQEVQAVLPEIVKEGEHLTVNYNGLTGLLIEAVKELSARVAELEAGN